LSKPRIRKGYRKNRVKRPVEKDVPTSYDSIWEYNLHNGLLKKWKHHGKKVPYVVNHTYHPDFSKKIGNKTYLIEAKGRFWDYAEFSKYLWIKKALPKNVELVFLFANPAAPMPQAKRRKDGTKRSHAEWAGANGFKWFSEESIPDDWIDKKYRESEQFKEEYFDIDKEQE
tara:strand:+ start:13564 stop:14076 length:513 start_codon:yes stop_codon:yes gene_type:complete